MKKYFNIQKTYVWLSIILFITLIFPLNILSMAIYLFMIFSIVIIIKKQVKIKLNHFIFLCFLFLMSSAIHILTDSNITVSAFETMKKASFVLLPFLWVNLPLKNKVKTQQNILFFFSNFLSIIGFLLILNAFYQFFISNDINVFFYHEFSQIIGVSAIYLSLLYSFSLIIIFDKYLLKPKIILLVLILFTTAIILLLASKIFVLILLFIYFFYILKLKTNRKTVALVFISFLAFSFFTKGDIILKRFSEININNIASLDNNITPSTTFDGFSLRKELVFIGLEISTKDVKTLFYGIGQGDTQECLNNELKDRGFYIGDFKKDLGFLNYNFHNQYIQTLVENGLFGLSILLLIILPLIYFGIKKNNNLLFLFNSIFLIAFFTESYLSRQIGIVSFVAFNSLFVYSFNSKKSFAICQYKKRIFDIVISSFVLVFFLSWFLPIILILIAIETKAFPIFVQERAGLNSVAFTCYKLRTMKINQHADNLPTQINDSRITKFGSFLRKYSIDELPQFFNVLIGNMSIVGPRPLMIIEEEEFNIKIPGFDKRLKMLPGLTGLAQSNGYKGYVSNVFDIRIRYKLDMLYLKKQSIILDIKIILKTVKIILK